MIRYPSLVSFLTITGALAAQQSGGPLVASAFAIAVQGGANGSADATTHVHHNGFGAPLQQFPVAIVAPDLQQILAFHGAPNLDVDDLSTGRDDIMVSATGHTTAPELGWGFFSFSFRDGAQGMPGSRLQAEPIADRGSAVFTWILPGSSVPTVLIDRVERSHSRSELAVPPGGDVDSIDLPLTLGLDQGALLGVEPGFQALLPPVAEIYFTVSNASVSLVPTLWWDPGGQPQPSGATIFVTRRAATTNGWTRPQVYKAFFELGLLQGEDIDGLAIDADDDKLIFSCVGNARDQLLFVDGNADAPVIPEPVKKPNGTPVSEAVGSAGGDDIDAVCTLDPRICGGFYQADDFGASCGTPRDPFQPGLYPVGISASAFRRFEGGQSFYDTGMIGWPPVTGAGPGFAVLGITIGDAVAPVITAAIAARNPGSAIVGDPQTFAQAIPATFILSGMPLTFRWFAIDAAGSEVVQAHPIKVFL